MNFNSITLKVLLKKLAVLGLALTTTTTWAAPMEMKEIDSNSKSFDIFYLEQDELAEDEPLSRPASFGKNICQNGGGIELQPDVVTPTYKCPSTMEEFFSPDLCQKFCR